MIPVSVRWNKWRMWRMKDGNWLAQQPFQIKDPMFKHKSGSGEEWPVFSFKHRDPARVLHEMQLAMAKAAADPEALRIEFQAIGGGELKPGVRVKVKSHGAFIGDVGVVQIVSKDAHKRARYSKEQGRLPILVGLKYGPVSFGPDDLEVVK